MYLSCNWFIPVIGWPTGTVCVKTVLPDLNLNLNLTVTTFGGHELTSKTV